MDTVKVTNLVTSIDTDKEQIKVQIKGGQAPSNSPKKSFKKPTLEMLVEKFRGQVDNPDEQAVMFFNHYEANGWMTGRSKMRSWTHAVGNWIIRGRKFKQGYKRNSTPDLGEFQ